MAGELTSLSLSRGVGLVTPGGGTPAALRVASSQNHISNATVAIARQNYANHKQDFIPKAVRKARYRIVPWFIPPGSTGPVTVLAQNVPIIGLWAACNGVVKQCTWDGATTRTVLTSESFVDTDPLSGLDFGFPTDVIPGGVNIFWSMLVAFGATGAFIHYTSGSTALATNQSQTYDPAVTTPKADNNGIITYTGTAPASVGGGAGFQGYTLGEPVEADFEALVVRGNSQSQNQDSWIQLVAKELNWPVLNLAVSSSKINAGLTDPKVAAMFGLATQGVLQFGRNEFPTSTVAALNALVAQEADRMKTNGIKRIAADETPPWTTSSDSWASPELQGYQTGSGPGELDETYNAGLSAISGIDYVTTRNSQANGSDRRKWLTNGTANYPTSDGKHAQAALEVLKAAENKSQIGTAKQIAKSAAELAVFKAEASLYAPDKTAAQTAVNSATALGNDMTLMQARLNAIVITIFTDPMAASYAANSDVPVANPLWVPDAAYVAGSIQYTGTTNGIKLTSATGGFIVAPQQGDTVEQQVQFTTKAANASNGVIALVYLNKDNWIGVTSLGLASLTQMQMSQCVAGVVSQICLFTYAVAGANNQVFRLKVAKAGSAYTLEAYQNGTKLSPTVANADDITALVGTGGPLAAARKSALGCRNGTNSTWLSTWSNQNVS